MTLDVNFILMFKFNFILICYLIFLKIWLDMCFYRQGVPRDLKTYFKVSSKEVFGKQCASCFPVNPA
jgi:hypothetical protein